MMNRNLNNLAKNKNKIIKEEDINISITDEHNEQEITSMGETGKSLGIISVINLPHLTISTANRTKSYSKMQYDSIYNKDNISTYTNFNNKRKDISIFEDEFQIEVRKLQFIFFYLILQYRKLLHFLEQKEVEKKNIYKKYNEKYIKCSDMALNIKIKKDKLDTIRRKNDYLKKLICKIMKEKNVFK